jgi:hypothetical protein
MLLNLCVCGIWAPQDVGMVMAFPPFFTSYSYVPKLKSNSRWPKASEGFSEQKAGNVVSFLTHLEKTAFQFFCLVGGDQPDKPKEFYFPHGKISKKKRGSIKDVSRLVSIIIHHQ